ncbi:MAG: hypothetical protein RLN85_04815, partial [Pseudomonadales bacterium]
MSSITYRPDYLAVALLSLGGGSQKLTRTASSQDDAQARVSSGAKIGKSALGSLQPFSATGSNGSIIHTHA